MHPQQRERLVELDLMRVLAAIAVVALHALGYYLATLPAGSTGKDYTQSLILSLRFARQAFMFVTGFLLTYTLIGRPFDARGFLSRRGRLILLPYLAWSLVYFLVARRFGMPTADGPWLGALLRNLVWGDGFYHLYYVIVTLQIYLLMPALLPLLRRVSPRQVALGLAAIIAAYPVLMAWWPSGDGIPAILARKDRIFLAYLPHFAAGLAAGAYPQVWQRWVRRLGPAATAGFFLALAYLLADLTHRGSGAFGAVISIFRPALMAYGLLGAVALWCAAGWLLRRGGPALAGLRRLAPYTYGIYLIHPLVLFLVETYGLKGVAPRWWHFLPLTAVGLGLTCALIWLLARTPAAEALLGARRVMRPGAPSAGRRTPALQIERRVTPTASLIRNGAPNLPNCRCTG